MQDLLLRNQIDFFILEAYYRIVLQEQCYGGKS